MGFIIKLYKIEVPNRKSLISLTFILKNLVTEKI